MPRKPISEPSHMVLRYSHKVQSRSTVKRHYELWRAKQSLPSRCDNQDCRFHIEPLVWNGQSLKPILDHVSGNSFDNSPGNLRHLCPNCDSQLLTRGGANADRLIERIPEGFTLQERDGRKTIARSAFAVGSSAAFAVGQAVVTEPLSGDA